MFGTCSLNPLKFFQLLGGISNQGRFSNESRKITMSTMQSADVDLAEKITKKYGFKECQDCAEELRSAFQKAGKTGKVLQLKAVGGRGNIVMKDQAFLLPFQTPPNASIAENGKHFGVQVGNLVFDNIHRSGIPLSDWADTFECDTQQLQVVPIETF